MQPSVLAKRSTRSGAVCRSVGSVVWLNRSTVERRKQCLPGEGSNAKSVGDMESVGQREKTYLAKLSDKARQW